MLDGWDTIWYLQRNKNQTARAIKLEQDACSQQVLLITREVMLARPT